MHDNETILKRLEKEFQSVVETMLKSEADIKGRYHLFEKNKEAIKTSVKESLSNHAFNLEGLEKEILAKKNAQNTEYERTLTTIDTYEKDAHKQYENDIEKLNNTLEEKKELSKMKAEKSHADYDFAVKKTTQEKLDLQKKADAAIDAAIEDHNVRVDDLERETNVRYMVNANRLEHKRMDFNQTYNTIKETYKAQIMEKEEGVDKAKKAYSDTLKERTKTHEKTMRPLNEAIDTLKDKQEKALKSVKDKQSDELSKHQSYRNEAKKLNDTTQLNKIDKTLKQLKKDHESTLEITEKQQAEALKPKIEERDKVYTEEQAAIRALKNKYIEAIEAALYDLDKAKSDEKIAINEANMAYNQAVAEYDQGKQAIRIDHDVQMVNFDQARDEIEQDKTHEKTLAQPRSNLKENEAVLHRSKADSEQKASDKLANAEHIRDKTKRTLDYDLALQSFVRDRSEARYSKDHALKDIEIHSWLKRYEKDYDHQAMLSDHYMKESENYTALKNDLIKAKKPAVDHEIQSWIKRQTKACEAVISEAKQDHEKMAESIERTYENERAIYQGTYDNLIKEHEQIIENMMTEQALERNRSVEEINRLDGQKGKKAKKKKRQLKQLLDQKQEAHDEALYKKKKTLEKKRAIYKDMLESIEDKRRQSLEEARTLLYHITDQINTHLATLGRLSKEASQSYSDLSYAVKHRAHLFRTFQHDRTFSTMETAKEYINTRIHRAKSDKTDNDARKDDQINVLNKDFEATQASMDEKKRQADKTYDDTAEKIEKEKIGTLSSLEQTFKDEKNRLELHISKLTKDYEDRKRSLKQQATLEKENFFEEKDQSERTLTQEKDRLEKAFEAEKETILDTLENTRGARRKTMEKLDDLMKKDSIHTMKATDAPEVLAVLSGEKDLSVLEDHPNT